MKMIILLGMAVSVSCLEVLVYYSPGQTRQIDKVKNSLFKLAETDETVNITVLAHKWDSGKWKGFEEVLFYGNKEHFGSIVGETDYAFNRLNNPWKSFPANEHFVNAFLNSGLIADLRETVFDVLVYTDHSLINTYLKKELKISRTYFLYLEKVEEQLFPYIQPSILVNSSGLNYIYNLALFYGKYFLSTSNDLLLIHNFEERPGYSILSESKDSPTLILSDQESTEYSVKSLIGEQKPTVTLTYSNGVKSIDNAVNIPTIRDKTQNNSNEHAFLSIEALSMLKKVLSK